MNNMKAFYHEHNTCTIEGKCVPISNCKNILPGSGFQHDDQNKQKNKMNWYEELLDDEYASAETLNFMMNSNSVENKSCTSDSCK
jgi:hypothetical protein